MAGGLLRRNASLLAKLETTYGTDADPTGSANAVLLSDLRMRPMDMTTVSRDLIRPFLGSSEQMPAEIYNGCEFSVELAGSGTAGTAPAIGPLLRACGFAETIDAGVKVEYTPVSAAFESVTLYVNMDGVLHRGYGCRGTVAFNLKNKDRPLARFNFTGLFVPIIDQALPTVDLAAWQKPLPLSRTNTPVFELHGYAAMLDDLQIDMANQVVYRGLIGGDEFVRITDRQPRGTVLMEAVKVADKDWWTSIRNVTTGPIELEHGLTAGNIVEVTGPHIQIHTPEYQEQDNILMLSAQLVFTPGPTGNDEIRLTFR